jgi:hypothetical protein
MSGVARSAAWGVKPQTAAKTVPTGTAEAVVSATPTILATQGVVIQALSTNSVSVYVGPSGVTTSNGIELQAGRDITIPCRDPYDIFVISGSASQAVRILWV